MYTRLKFACSSLLAMDPNTQMFEGQDSFESSLRKVEQLAYSEENLSSILYNYECRATYSFR